MTKPISEVAEEGRKRMSDPMKVGELRRVAKIWLEFAEDQFYEFDFDICTEETLCPKCRSSGCINQKIVELRQALIDTEDK